MTPEDSKSNQNLIRNHLVARCLPRSPEDGPTTSQDCPKTAQDDPQTPPELRGPPQELTTAPRGPWKLSATAPVPPSQRQSLKEFFRATPPSLPHNTSTCPVLKKSWCETWLGAAVSRAPRVLDHICRSVNQSVSQCLSIK